eukprot:COSAG05_NODE_11_length_38500_cov_831.349861_42_plen_161_part_00
MDDASSRIGDTRPLPTMNALRRPPAAAEARRVLAGKEDVMVALPWIHAIAASVREAQAEERQVSPRRKHHGNATDSVTLTSSCLPARSVRLGVSLALWVCVRACVRASGPGKKSGEMTARPRSEPRPGLGQRWQASLGWGSQLSKHAEPWRKLRRVKHEK